MTTATEASRSAAEWALEETHYESLEAEYKEFQRRCRLRLNVIEHQCTVLDEQIRALQKEREFLLKHAAPEGR